MSEKGNVAIDAPDDAVQEALTDHHLDEIAEMIERAQAQEPASESVSRNIPPGYLRDS
jgi:hypothetical protein